MQFHTQFPILFQPYVYVFHFWVIYLSGVLYVCWGGRFDESCVCVCKAKAEREEGGEIALAVVMVVAMMMAVYGSSFQMHACNFCNATMFHILRPPIR